VLTAVVVSITPFFVIFIVTPLIGRALSLIAGFFIWLTAFGIMDAVMHQAAIDQGIRVFESVRQNMLGYDAIMMLPGAAEKSLAMFGYVRSFGMMLATIATGILVKFGGHALAMMSGSLSGSISSTATSAGQSTQDPAGSASMIHQQRESMPTHSFYAKYSPWKTWRSGMGQREWGLADGLGKSQVIEQQGLENVTQAQANKLSAQVGEGLGYGDTNTALQSGMISTQELLGKQDKLRMVADRYFDGDIRKAANWLERGGHLQGELARKFERENGLKEGTLENTRIDMVSRALDTTGKFKSVSFISDTGDRRITVSGGRIKTEGIDEEGFSYQMTQDAKTGALINYTGRKVQEKDETITDASGNRITIGAGTDITKIGDGDAALYHYRGKINDGEGTLMMDSKGNIIASRNVKGIEDKNVGVRDEIIKTDMGDVKFTGTRIDTSSGVSELNGTFTMPDGKIYKGDAQLKDGKLIMLRGNEGTSLSTIQEQKSHENISIDQLKQMRDEFKEAHGPQSNVARNINRAIQNMENLGLTQATVAIAQKPGSGSAEYATMSIKSGDNSLTESFNLTQKGHEDVTKALKTTNIGNRFENFNSHKHIPKGMKEVQFWNPSTETWETGIAKVEDGQLKLVSGDRTYGVHEDMLVWKDAVYQMGDKEGKVITEDGHQWFVPSDGSERIGILSPDAVKLKTPGGIVRWQGRVTPDGSRVEGQESSVIVSRGQLNVGDKGFDAHIYTDSRTGWQMAINAETGAVYKATAGRESWVLQLGMTVKGDAAATGVMNAAEKLGASPEAARDAGFLTGAMTKGIGDVGTIVGTQKFLPKHTGKTPKTPSTTISGGSAKGIPGMP
jgi:hypothetical protein